MGNNAGLYALTDEHEAIREAVRDIAEREIAPFAAEVDADSRYPVEAQKALTTAGFHATHIPEAYGGPGLLHQGEEPIGRGEGFARVGGRHGDAEGGGRGGHCPHRRRRRPCPQ